MVVHIQGRIVTKIIGGGPSWFSQPVATTLYIILINDMAKHREILRKTQVKCYEKILSCITLKNKQIIMINTQ